MIRRVLVVVAIILAVEIAWALFCAITGVNLFVFYGVLVVASLAFWVPGLLDKRSPTERPQTNR